MKIVALILLGLLAVWWGILSVWVISCHRDRVRAAAKPMTPEELEDCRKLEESLPQYRMRLRDYLVTSPFMIPFIFFLLPIYLWSWLAKDPYAKHE